MPLYEHVFIARQDISSTQVEGLVSSFTELLEKDGGKIVNTEYWGLKNLAYRIKKNRKGHYVMLNIESPSSGIDELERTERINEDVLRYLTLRVEAHEEGPSIMDRGKKDRPQGIEMTPMARRTITTERILNREKALRSQLANQ